MSASSLVHFKQQGQGQAVILLHGLFGSLDNLGLLARALSEHFQVISVDLRNHGASFHHPMMDYPSQAQDILALLDHLGLTKAAIVGHSMGGKVAMQLAKLAPSRVSQLVVADIAPVAYPQVRHHNVFAGLHATEQGHFASRAMVESCLAEHIELPFVRQFLLKSLAKTEQGWRWRFNVSALWQNYATIMGWPDDTRRYEGPVLFIKGALSDYMLAEYREQALAQFPHANVRILANTGHWLHAQKPAIFNKWVVDFLSIGG